MYFSIFTFYKTLISCIITSSLSYAKDYFLKWSLWKLSYVLKLKQTNLENWLNISTESPKAAFNDIVFQHFVDKLKH